MLLLDELRLELEGYRKDMADLYNILNIDKLKEDNAKLQEQSAAGRSGELPEGYADHKAE